MDTSAIAARLRECLDDEVVREVVTEGAMPWILVDPDRVAEVGLVLRDEDDLAFDRLLVISGFDYEGIDENGKGRHRKIAQYAEDGSPEEVTDPATGDFGVGYFLQSRRHMHQVVIKVRVPRETPVVQSLSSVYPTADWSERETYDMYGIEFEGHPDLRRLLLPEDWEGFPLRKDYQMPRRYHDVPLEGLPLAVREKQTVEVEDAPAPSGDGEGGDE